MKPIQAIAIVCSAHLLLCAHTVNAQPDKLPALGVKLNDVTVSGLSSGAFMASQLYIVNSQIMSGAGIIAGGPYLCALSWDFQSHVQNATGSCMNPLTHSSGPNTPHLSSLTRQLAEKGDIDSITNLVDDKIYLFNGKADHTVTTTVMDQTYQYFLDLGINKDAIEYVTDVDAGHAIVTTSFGNKECAVTEKPFINDCDIYQAKDILNHLYSGLSEPAADVAQAIVEFDQTEFIKSGNTSMSDSAFVYIPEGCREGGCRLHIVYHGCLQGYTEIGDQYYMGTGYNQIADANDIVMLYPQVEPSSKDPFNPQGCWDFWGYSQPNKSEPDFYSKHAPQLSAVRAMIDRLAEPVN